MRRLWFPSRRLWAAYSIPVLLFAALAAWAWASPVGSSPDDDFHLPSIWCGLGERDGLCETTDVLSAREVPATLTTATCFAFDETQTGACWDPRPGGLAATERVNAGPLYPPIFYATLSIFASPDPQISVLAMRLFNAALFVSLSTAVFWASPRSIRPAVAVAALAPVVPLGLFVIASTNPSAWAYTSASVVYASMLGVTQAQGRRRMVLVGLAVLGALVGAGARADAAIFAVFAAGIALLIGWQGVRDALVPLVTGAVISALAVVLFFSARQGGSAITGLPGFDEPLTAGEHLSNLLNVPALWTGALGGWGLGWLDTLLPAVVPVLGTAVVAAAFLLGLDGAGPRRLVAVVVAVAALWLVPFILLAQSNAMVGTQVQPRYILPLLVVVLAVAASGPTAERQWRGLRLGAAALALSVSSAVSLFYNIRRYTVGTDGPASLDPGHDAEWWWTGVPGPWVVWVVGSAALVGALALLWACVQRAPQQIDSPTVPTPDHQPPLTRRSLSARR